MTDLSKHLFDTALAMNRAAAEMYAPKFATGQRVQVQFAVASSNPIWRDGVVVGHAWRGTEERPYQAVRVEIDGHVYPCSPRSVRAA